MVDNITDSVVKPGSQSTLAAVGGTSVEMNSQRLTESSTEKDMYARLWKCRDFEIDHVWQRAVFLSAFLLACFASYGGLIVSLSTAEKVRVSLPFANCIAFLICVIGILLSFIWIMMAKGSKAWYEHYEAAIAAVEASRNKENTIDCAILQIHKREKFEIPTTSSWLWSTKGGAYSVAKINIVLGHLSSIVWMALTGFHLYVAKLSCEHISEVETAVCRLFDSHLMAIVLVVILASFWLYSRVSIRSSFLKDTE